MFRPLVLLSLTYKNSTLVLLSAPVCRSPQSVSQSALLFFFSCPSTRPCLTVCDCGRSQPASQPVKPVIQQQQQTSANSDEEEDEVLESPVKDALMVLQTFFTRIVVHNQNSQATQSVSRLKVYRQNGAESGTRIQ